jgi:XTP/dITP diphosphohydrolase
MTNNIRKIILSSGNMHKIKEIKEILKDMPFEIVSKDDMGFRNFDVLEDGKTLEENALKKAFGLHKLIKGIIIADDTGLFVDALNGDPGVYSARYAGEHATDKENNKLLLKNLINVPMEKRTAYFKTVMAIVLENGDKVVAEGICKGKIATEPKGKNGFGYDSLFIVDSMDKTMGELADDEKNKISHRANALLNLKKKLEEFLSENNGSK